MVIKLNTVPLIFPPFNTVGITLTFNSVEFLNLKVYVQCELLEKKHIYFCCDNQVACLLHVIAENLVKCCETLVDCVDSRVHILSS